jgi:hypothetical protein
MSARRAIGSIALVAWVAAMFADGLPIGPQIVVGCVVVFATALVARLAIAVRSSRTVRAATVGVTLYCWTWGAISMASRIPVPSAVHDAAQRLALAGAIAFVVVLFAGFLIASIFARTLEAKVVATEFAGLWRRTRRV